MTADERGNRRTSWISLFLKSFNLSDFLYKSMSLKLFILSSKEVSRVPLGGCFFLLSGLTLVVGFSLVIFGFGVCENVRL